MHVATLQQKKKGGGEVLFSFCNMKRIKDINRIIQNATCSQIMH